MTKFYNYINETVDKNEAIEMLLKECEPFLKDLKKAYKSSGKSNFLYSGRKSSDFLITKKIRKNRKPLHTPELIHNKLDDMFKEKFGIKARSNSLFTYTDWYSVDYYGNPYYVFPVGKKYRFIWNNKVGDLFVELEKMLKNEFKKKFNVRNIMIPGLKSMFNFIEDGNVYIFKEERGEILFINNIKNIENINSDNIINKDVLSEMLDNILPNLMSNYEMSDKPNYPDDKEIMIYCNEVIMINMDEFSKSELIEDLLGGV